MDSINNIKDPAFSLKLIRFFCKTDLAEELEGNLIEYHRELKEASTTFLFLKYWYQVFNYIRPSTLKSITQIKNRTMFYFNPLITIRNLYKHRSTSILNILGFTLGLTAAIFLYFYVASELSYDSFHADKDQIYRVRRYSEINGESYNIAVTSGPYAEALKTEFPLSIKSTMRVGQQSGIVSYQDKKFTENKLVFVDNEFFKFFDFPLAVGNSSSVLGTGKGVVISKEVAKKYFGDEDPIGKILEVDNEYQFAVTGILDDFPAKSHIEFDMAFSIDIFNRFEWFNDWWSNGVITYVKVATPEEASKLESQFHAFMDKYMGDNFEETGRRVDINLEPFNELYFNTDIRYDSSLHGDRQSVNLLILVALAILFIACFNYINLSISHSFIRSKEISVRKVLGVEKGRLILQFLGESFMILLFAVLLAVTISNLLLPSFNFYFGLDVSFDWLDQKVLLFFSAMIMIVLITSGLYPALLMSSFKAVNVLKGGKSSPGRSTMIRKGLVITQFAKSQIF